MSTQLCKPATLAPEMQIQLGVEGYYTLRVMKADADGNPIKATAREIEVKNLITNFGMDSMGTTGQSLADRFWNECVVGTGNTPPAFTDTALASFLAATSSNVGNSTVTRQIVTSPRWIEVAKTWRFNAGVAAGNIAEVGVRRQNGAPINLFSRALIVDAVGTPTTLTVLSDEVLDVTYRLRYFIPEADVTGVVNLNGTNYNWTLRPVAIGQTSFLNGDIPGWPSEFEQSLSGYGVRGTALASTGATSTTSTKNCVAGVAMTAMDVVPVLNGFTNRAPDSVAPATYTAGTYFVDNVFTWGLTRGNNAGITLAVVTCEFGSFQIGFSPSFTKLSTQQLRLTLRVSWARRP